MIDPARPDYRHTPASFPRQGDATPHGDDVEPRVSIVTPFFNTGSVFHETAATVFAQSLRAWEWLIVNDGSSAADALLVLDRYRDGDRRVRVIDRSSNGGPAAARNTGAASARARYLLLLDSDDLLEPTAAEKWWWFLESYPEFGFVKGFSVGFGAMQYLSTSGFHDETAFLERNRADITSLVRAEVFRAVGGFPEGNRDGLEDWEFWLRCARGGFWGGTVPEYLSWYRRRDDDARRWHNWQGDQGSAALRSRLRREFHGLYTDASSFPRPRPRQIRDSGTRAWGPPGHRRDAESDRLRALGGEPAQAEGGTRPGERNQPGRTASRLLMIVPWLTLGGADKFNLDLVGELSARGWTISVAAVLQGDMSWLAAFTARTPDVFVLPDIIRLSDYPHFLRDLIASRQIDVVLITNAELGYRLLPYLRAQCPQVAFVDFCHMEQEEWLEGGYPRLSLDAEAGLDCSVVLSAHLRDWMIARGRPSRNLFVSHNGVASPADEHIAQQRALWRRRWSVNDTPVIVYAGRAVEQKQPLVLVDALGRLHAEGVEFLAIIAGDGPELPAMRQRIEQAGVGRRVQFLGAVTPETMDGVLCAADLLCLPSKWEGISLVVQEAMARGVAVVTADVGGQRELVTPGCGVLIAPGPPEALSAAYAQALLELIGRPEDRRARGAAARLRVQASFRLDQMGDRMDALLKGVSRREGPVAGVDPSSIMESVASQYVPYYQWVQAMAHSRAETPSWNTRLFRSLTVLEPVYRWGLRRGWTRLPALRRWLRGHVRAWLQLDA